MWESIHSQNSYVRILTSSFPRMRESILKDGFTKLNVMSDPIAVGDIENPAALAVGSSQSINLYIKERSVAVLVYVLNKDGQPLMLTGQCGKVRRLLRDKKAKAVKRCSLTIQLLYEIAVKFQFTHQEVQFTHFAVL